MTRVIAQAERNLGLCLLLLLICGLPAWPQASTGSINGTVRDQTGAVIPNATLEVTNSSTNVKFRSTSNDAGFYIFPSLIPGPYVLTVASPGMQRYEAEITVQVPVSYTHLRAHETVLDLVCRLPPEKK